MTQNLIFCQWLKSVSYQWCRIWMIIVVYFLILLLTLRRMIFRTLPLILAMCSGSLIRIRINLDYFQADALLLLKIIRRILKVLVRISMILLKSLIVHHYLQVCSFFRVQGHNFLEKKIQPTNNRLSESLG